MKKIILFILFLIPLIAFSEYIDVDYGSVDQVELIGLESMSSEQFFNALNRCDDGSCNINDVFKIYCNACYDKVFDFPSLHADSKSKDNGKMKVAISIVDTLYRNEVKNYSPPKDTLKTLDEFIPIFKAFFKNQMEFQFTIYEYHKGFNPTAFYAQMKEKYDTVYDTLWMKNFNSQIQKVNNTASLEKAINIIQNDANRINRLSAILTFLNFPDKPEAVNAILDLIRSEEKILPHIALMVFKSFKHSDNFNLKINGNNSLKYLLYGSNIGNFDDILKILSEQTNLAEEDRKFIFHYGKRMITHYLNSETYGQETMEAVCKISGKQFTDISECCYYLDRF